MHETCCMESFQKHIFIDEYVLWCSLFLVHANDHFAGLPRMEALVRIANIPIVETGVKTAGKVYCNLKVNIKIIEVMLNYFSNGFSPHTTSMLN